MKLFWLVCAVFGVQSACSTLVNFRNCTSDSYPTRIESIDVNPWPIRRGADVTITVVGDTPFEIQGGSFDAVVTKFGFKLLELGQSFCDYTQCPIEPGQVTLAVSKYVGSSTPQWQVQVRITGTDTNGKELFCELFDASISSMMSSQIQ
eukprot:TRINITY_DN5275_c0_g1_i2.p1 TRINITY_DN5275_c0_g1~~TRINITY_DN5275_c0_g1_i2.p1  ORF type:complete len:149 (+),score=26.89 TRINITY_DN5275_c0_g1_i2:46-492(+)